MDIKYYVEYGFLNNEAFVTEMSEEFPTYKDALNQFNKQKQDMNESSCYKAIGISEIAKENDEIISVCWLKEYSI